MLRPGGRFVFVEHVTARRPRASQAAQRLSAPFARLPWPPLPLPLWAQQRALNTANKARCVARASVPAAPLPEGVLC